MLKRTALITLSAVVLLAIAAPACFAQTWLHPYADAGVRGYGAIAIPSTNPQDSRPGIGRFSVNVGTSEDGLFGRLYYFETDSAGRRVHTVYSEKITGLRVEGNFATVEAIGRWNGMPAILKLEALDDNPSGDWFHIMAIPCTFLPGILDRQGGLIYGDIMVYGKPPAYTKGYGTIYVPRNNTYQPNIGSFSFAVETVNGAPKGYLYFVEYSPYDTTNAWRPEVRIYLRDIRELRISGREAIFSGQGTFNGQRASIEVRAVDNSPAYRMRDEFYIRALVFPDSGSMPFVYDAGGPLRTGEIVVSPTNEE